MDRSLTAALTRPRHILASLGLFLLLGGLGGALVGIAQAADPAPTVPGATPVGSFTGAEPRAGDRGLYEVRPLQGENPEEALQRTHERAIAFEWSADQVVRGGDGVAQWANLVRVNRTTTFGDGRLDFRDELIAITPGSLDGFASIMVYNNSRDEDGVRSYGVTAQTNFVARERALPCGFRSAVQGTTLAVPGGPLPTEALCDQGPGKRDGDDRSLYLREAVTKDGVTYLRAEVRDRGRSGLMVYDEVAITFLFRSDIPYPLQIQREGEPHVLALTAFERGDQSVRSGPEVLLGTPPPLQFAARQPWGPDDGGVEHPFPASEAFNRAFEDSTYPALREFMAEHPDAYAGSMHYGNLYSTGADGEWQYWNFAMTDGKVQLDFHVRRITGSNAQSLLPPGILPGPVPQYDYSDRGVEDAVGRYPLASAIPSSAPTAASLLQQWDAYASAAYADKGGNSWSVSYDCAYDHDSQARDCTQVETRAQGGFMRYDRTYGDPSQPWPATSMQEPIDGYISSTLAWMEVPGRSDLTLDRPSHYFDQRVDWRREGQASPVADPPQFAGSASSLVPFAVAGVWVLPDAEGAAAIGGGAFLLGLLYYLWPAIKTGFVGLFSRVQPEELLEHPTRAMLVAAVEAEPGIHHQELVRLARKGNGAAEHHLQKLVTGGLLARHKSAGYTCYFRAGKVDRRVMASAHLLKSPVARAIVEAAQRSPGTSLAQVARDAGVAVPTVHYHAKRLQEAGLVRWEGGLYPGARAGPAAAATASA